MKILWFGIFLIGLSLTTDVVLAQQTEERTVVTVDQAPLIDSTAAEHVMKELHHGGRVDLLRYEGDHLQCVAGNDTEFFELAPPRSEIGLAASAQSLQLRCSPADADTFWSRAKQFVMEYSDMISRTETDALIQTDNPDEPALYGYSIRKATDGDDVIITVDCLRYTAESPDEFRDEAEMNAHICAYYIKTGLMDSDELN